MRILVTGGAGFIGSALVRYLINLGDVKVHVIDKLTYAGNLNSLSSVSDSPNYGFSKIDITDYESVLRLLNEFKPNGIMHLAAESHVDRSINGPSAFIETNIIGTYTLLEVCRKYYEALTPEEKVRFRFHHISTDEVYGDLDDPTELFTESTPYAPSSPYSASKAASDHLVRAWNRTYDLPVLITNCSNNYGPYHFPEKLIPLTIINAIQGKSIPVYGDGKQIRDWLYVDDHVNALFNVFCNGQVGETYNIGGFNEKTNIEVVTTICNILNEICQQKPEGITDFKSLISFVKDRPGHDKRYAIDASKINKELGWFPSETFQSGIKKTVLWFLANPDWLLTTNTVDGFQPLAKLKDAL